MEEMFKEVVKSIPAIAVIAWMFLTVLKHLANADERREQTLRAAHSMMQQIVQQVETTMQRVDSESCRREEQTSAVISKCADAMTRMSVLMERLDRPDAAAAPR